MIIRQLDADDVPYALTSWRESHKQSPGHDKVPWGYYKATTGAAFSSILTDPGTRKLGAYAEDDMLLGFLVMTPGKRVHTLHWVQTKYRVELERIRRQGVMTALFEVADLGKRFVYTCRGPRRKVELPDGSTSKSMDQVYAANLAARGITATFVDLKEWLR
jgi:hypothetical protein